MGNSNSTAISLLDSNDLILNYYDNDSVPTECLYINQYGGGITKAPVGIGCEVISDSNVSCNLNEKSKFSIQCNQEDNIENGDKYYYYKCPKSDPSACSETVSPTDVDAFKCDLAFEYWPGFTSKDVKIKESFSSGSCEKDLGYNIKKYIASGSYGEVHEVYKLRDDYKYVLKIQYYKDGYTKLDREEKITKLFQSLGIGPKVLMFLRCNKKVENPKKKGDGAIYNRHFTIMDEWSGELSVDDKLDSKLVRKVLKQIETIHSLGYVHGDLKRGNVFVNRDAKGNVVDITIADFGVSDIINGFKDKTEWTKKLYCWAIDCYKLPNPKTRDEIINNPVFLDYGFMKWFKETYDTTEPLNIKQAILKSDPKAVENAIARGEYPGIYDYLLLSLKKIKLGLTSTEKEIMKILSKNKFVADGIINDLSESKCLRHIIDKSVISICKK